MATSLSLRTASSCDLCGESNDEHIRVMVFSTGKLINYTVPSFPVFSVVIREMKYKFLASDTDDAAEQLSEQAATDIYDGYMNSDSGEIPSFSSPLLSLAKVCSGFKNGFFIDIDEFARSNVSELPLQNLFLGNLVFVMWKWEWEYNHGYFDVNATRSEMIQEDDDYELYEDDEQQTDGTDMESTSTICDEELVTNHAVIFKCIGCNKSQMAQELLRSVSKLHEDGKSVSVRIQPEPNNPKDARAVRFECSVNGQDWNPIGYVVKEALDCVHLAIEKGEIVSITFEWVKYVTHWSASGPGWYCGIKIIKKGLWSKAVIQCKSTM